MSKTSPRGCMIFTCDRRRGNFCCSDCGYRNTNLFDWDGNAWKYGYPFYPKSRCVELERGMCEGGPNIPQMAARMREKYEPSGSYRKE